MNVSRIGLKVVFTRSWCTVQQSYCPVFQLIVSSLRFSAP